MRSHRGILAASTCFALSTLSAADAPAWLTSAAAQPHGAYDGTVSGVVLLDERNISVERDGKIIETQRRAVKILNRQGLPLAAGRVPYFTGTGKIRELNGWVILPGGAVKKLGKEHVADLSMPGDDLYNETRIRSILGESEAQVQAVFGFESVAEDKSIFTQFAWTFQERVPVLQSRLSLTLPPGWTSNAITFDAAPVKGEISGATTTWAMTSLPALESEDGAPLAASPRLGVSYFPSGESGTASAPSFRNWGDVSRWMSTLHDPQSQPDGEVEAKAKALAAGKATPWEKAEAIARYVQQIRYVSIQTGIGRGGGYKPRAAGSVLRNGYGDCKDKANLMRSLLQAAGVRSWPVAIFSGDRTYARAEWPTPQQFNHAIIAIELDGPAREAQVTHAALGSLLLFDPTDPDVPFGRLPDHEQSSNALLIAGDRGGLITTPASAPDRNRTVRTVKGSLSPEGELTLGISDKYAGAQAVRETSRYKLAGAADYKLRKAEMLHRMSSAAVLEKISFRPETGDSLAEADWEIRCARCGQPFQNRLLRFHPVLLRDFLFLDVSRASRRQAILLDSRSLDETVRIQIPDGFLFDEVPDPVRLQTSFGTLSATWEEHGRELVFRRSIDIPAQSVAAADYGAFRKFMGLVRGTEAAPVVLIRKP